MSKINNAAKTQGRSLLTINRALLALRATYLSNFVVQFFLDEVPGRG